MTSINHVQEDPLINIEGDLQSTLSSTTVSIVDANLPNVLKCFLECFICMEPPTNAISTSCGHVFCWPCIHQWLQNRPKPCPVCRHTLQRDLDIIPLYGGGGAGEEPSNSNNHSGEIGASNSFIPPRPHNPLLLKATTNTDDAKGIENLDSSATRSVSRVTVPRSVLIIYQRLINEMHHELSVKKDMVREMAIMGNNLCNQVNFLEQELLKRDLQLFRERKQKLLSDNRVNKLERRNSLLIGEARVNQAKEQYFFERGFQMEEHIAKLQKQLNQANEQLPPR